MHTMNFFIGKLQFSHTRNQLRSFLLLFLGLGVYLPGFGQTLEDFETASNSAGAGLIPYESMRREANSLETEVTYRQKGAAGLGPSTLGPEKNKILKAQRYAQEQLKKAQAEFDKYKASSTSSFNPYEDDVKKYQKELEGLDRDLVAINGKIDDGIEALSRFYNARGGLRELFEDVVDKLKSSKGRPSDHLGSAPSSSDAAATKAYKEKETLLKTYIDRIISKIEAGVSTHRREEDITKGQVDELKTLKARTAPF
jgi:uncharacterized phage infection (PIP) family protein YhgE